jgi:hypothetical protein
MVFLSFFFRGIYLDLESIFIISNNLIQQYRVPKTTPLNNIKNGGSMIHRLH